MKQKKVDFNADICEVSTDKSKLAEFMLEKINSSLDNK
jgi:hypothetical protein